jgi:hypothetical protein
MRLSFVRLSLAVTLASLCTLAAPAVHAGDPPPAGATVDPAKLEEAKKHMQAGAAFYNDPSGHKCEEAIREFGKAYELSGSLNALKGQAVCNLELERDGEAIDQYSKYLAGKGASIDPADKQQVETDLNALKAVVAYVQFNTDQANVKLTDTRQPSRGFPIINRYQLPISGRKIGLHPGHHTIVASADGVTDVTWTLDISNGQKLDHLFEFDKGKPVVAEGDKTDKPVEPKMVPVRPVPKSVYVMGGVTVALAVPWVILMVRANGKAADYKAANGHQPAATLQPLHDDVKSADLLADIFLGLTAASAVTTTVLALTRPTKMVPEAPPKAGTIHVLPTLGGAVVTGAF